MIDEGLTASSLLALWERGEEEGSGRRALRLLSGAAPAAGDWPGMSVGRRDGTLLDLREKLFGRRFVAITGCPACGEAIELSFDIGEVRRDGADVERATLQVDGIEVGFRVPNAGDLAAIEAAGDLATARAMLLTRCVDRAVADGRVLAIDDLPPRVVEATVERMRDLDPQADVTLDVDCPTCGHAWREPFDVVTFLWAELHAWARRLLGEVHLLASAYGWSEEQILGLTPARRNAYLEMLQ